MHVCKIFFFVVRISCDIFPSEQFQTKENEQKKKHIQHENESQMKLTCDSGRKQMLCYNLFAHHFSGVLERLTSFTLSLSLCEKVNF